MNKYEGLSVFIFTFQASTLPEDEELVDPDPPIDVAALNQKIIDLDDRLFFQLEESRWCPELAVFGLKEQRPQKLPKSVIVIDWSHRHRLRMLSNGTIRYTKRLQMSFYQEDGRQFDTSSRSISYERWYILHGEPSISTKLIIDDLLAMAETLHDFVNARNLESACESAT